MPLRLPITTTIAEPVTIIQPDEEQLRVTAIQLHNTPYFKELPHDTLTTVWTPTAGTTPHIVALIVSVEAAGVCYIYKNDTEFLRLEFNEKKSQPFGMGTDVHFEADTVIKAKFVGDAATPSGYITIVGHEHEI